MSAGSPPPIDRHYSAEEMRAFITVSPLEWGQTYTPRRGPAWYATGPWWPKRLREQAARLEKRAAAMRLAAAAMEREGCR